MDLEHTSLIERGALALRTSPLLRLLTMGGIILLLLLPIDWISGLIKERTDRRNEAVDELSLRWGRTQTILGPFLTVPYEVTSIEAQSAGSSVDKSETRVLTIVPDDLRIAAHAASEERAWGIFSMPVYRATVKISGAFAAPDLAVLGIKPENVDWQNAVMSIGLSDTRTVQSQNMRWAGRDLSFQPGAGVPGIEAGIHVRIDQPFSTTNAAFDVHLSANGSGALNFKPVGGETSVKITSNWPSPSFMGNWLPTTRTVTDAGFEAVWNVPFLGRNQPVAWASRPAQALYNVDAATLGVHFIPPIEVHAIAQRSIKYAHLFLVLTFATIWLIEVLTAQHVHPIQYLLIGCALCLFYLLELSLSEQIGFSPAYTIAATAVVGLLGLYAVSVLNSSGRAAIMAGSVTSLYAYLYVVLTNEDYALLLGSLVLFVALAIIMLTTRRIDWYGAVQEQTLRVNLDTTNEEAL